MPVIQAFPSILILMSLTEINNIFEYLGFQHLDQETGGCLLIALSIVAKAICNYQMFMMKPHPYSKASRHLYASFC